MKVPYKYLQIQTASLWSGSKIHLVHIFSLTEILKQWKKVHLNFMYSEIPFKTIKGTVQKDRY